jgi:hypothetical protein
MIRPKLLVPLSFVLLLAVHLPSPAKASACDDMGTLISYAAQASVMAAAYEVAGKFAFACAVESRATRRRRLALTEQREISTCTPQIYEATSISLPNLLSTILPTMRMALTGVSNKHSQLHLDDDIKDAAAGPYDLAKKYRSWI